MAFKASVLYYSLQNRNFVSEGYHYQVAAALAVGVGFSFYYIYKRCYKQHLPTEWTEVGVLDKLFTYPIKSCGPVEFQDAECTAIGLKKGWLRDRTLMVVDGKSNFISARAYPQMLLVKPEFDGSILRLRHPKMEQVQVDLAEVKTSKKITRATVWGVSVPVYNCGWEVSEWFSRLLLNGSHELSLVLYASESGKSLRSTADSRLYKFRKDDTGALPDEAAFNMVNAATIDDLNRRLRAEDKVSLRNFRPNFVLKGAQPMEEDQWKFVRIGSTVLEIIKPCFRCVMTTIDPETGVQNANNEPICTLKKYRQSQKAAERKTAGESPRLGIQMALRSGSGSIHVGDPVSVAL